MIADDSEREPDAPKHSCAPTTLGVLREDYGEACGALYDAAPTLLPAWLDDPDRCRHDMEGR